MPAPDTTITLRDPRALRALAHPARQRLVTELFGGRVLTATEAAGLVGLTPSAVSHHLRALEKWGLARRAPDTQDGRERPWEGTARALRLEPSDAPSLAAMESLVTTQLGDLNIRLRSFLDTRAADPWGGSYQGLARGELFLTREETIDVRDRVAAILEEYHEDRTADDRPPASRRTSFTWSLVPMEPPPD